jgi:hypothetical protein
MDLPDPEQGYLMHKLKDLDVLIEQIKILTDAVNGLTKVIPKFNSRGDMMVPTGE